MGSSISQFFTSLKQHNHETAIAAYLRHLRAITAKGSPAEADLRKLVDLAEAAGVDAATVAAHADALEVEKTLAPDLELAGDREQRCTDLYQAIAKIRDARADAIEIFDAKIREGEQAHGQALGLRDLSNQASNTLASLQYEYAILWPGFTGATRERTAAAEAERESRLSDRAIRINNGDNAGMVQMRSA